MPFGIDQAMIIGYSTVHPLVMPRLFQGDASESKLDNDPREARRAAAGRSITAISLQPQGSVS
jgi:hypothetical protein